MIRSCLAALCVASAMAGPVRAAPPPLAIQVVNEAQLPPSEVDALLADYRAWGERVARYLGVTAPAPVKLVFTRDAPVGLYVDDAILMPPGDDRDDMRETWIHELTHHFTGHDSSYFFKEGIATHVLEQLYAQDHRVPEGWPQYGARNDDWVRLFAARGQLPPLAQAMAHPRYDGSSPERDYRSWQVYAIAGSFEGWYVRRFGMEALLRAFRAEAMPQPLAELERDWLATLAGSQAPLPDPVALLPSRPRYQYYARQLGSK